MLTRKILEIKDNLNLLLKGRIEIKEGSFPRIFIYKDYVETESNGKSRFISGFLIKGPTRQFFSLSRELNDSFLVRGFENLLYSLQRGKIPLSYIYISSFNDKEGAESAVYLLTYGGDEDSLKRNLDIIETSFRSVFPQYDLERIGGKEVFEMIGGFFSEIRRSEPGPVLLFNPPAPTRSTGTKAPEYYVPDLKEANRGNILLGKCISGSDEGPEIRICKEDLSVHLIILGVTGSGKTTTAATLLNRLSREGVKYLVFDWANEYSKLLKESVDIVYSPGLTKEFSINPLIPMEFEDEAEHLAMVSDIFADIYNFTHPQSFMFKEALNVALEHYKVFGDEIPNLKTLIMVLEKLPLKSYFDAEIKLALIRRIKPLTEGQAGKALCGSKNIKISELMDKNVIIELGHFRETRTRQIFTQLLLKQIYGYKTRGEMGSLTHVTVVEEGRYVVPARRAFDPPSLAERMIAELRKFGESVFVISQFPTQISLETIKNAGCLIIHRLTGPQDLEIIREVISLSNKQLDYIKRLRAGEAVVRINRFHEPILVRIKPDVYYLKNLDRSPLS
ncbi:hypothetical protein DRN86_01650 [Candidatus Geothermarchaeota archaeon]|nr:MAG: hypothetical protein DRN86_01650 [Candidatus Geothermarchaeota archaeon]